MVPPGASPRPSQALGVTHGFRRFLQPRAEGPGSAAQRWQVSERKKAARKEEWQLDTALSPRTRPARDPGPHARPGAQSQLRLHLPRRPGPRPAGHQLPLFIASSASCPRPALAFICPRPVFHHVRPSARPPATSAVLSLQSLTRQNYAAPGLSRRPESGRTHGTGARGRPGTPTPPAAPRLPAGATGALRAVTRENQLEMPPDTSQ